MLHYKVLQSFSIFFFLLISTLSLMEILVVDIFAIKFLFAPACPRNKTLNQFLAFRIKLTIFFFFKYDYCLNSKNFQLSFE